MKKYARFFYQPCIPLGENGTRVTASKKHIELSRKAAGEGMVLLKNNGTLPLDRGTKIALFGQASVNYMKGGGGSGDVYCPYIRNLYDGFRVKASEGKAEVFSPLEDFYKEHVKKEQRRGKECWEKESPEIERIEGDTEKGFRFGELYRKMQVREAKLSSELLEAAAAFTDTAVVAIGRYSGESWDRASEKGDFYLTDEEQELVDTVKASFKKCIIVLNVGGMVDTKWLKDDDKIDAVLLAWQAGMEGGLAIADILCGDVNPSGKLTDTFAGSFDDYPSSAHFNDSGDYVDYTEDIYVGYRYFETIPGAKEKVNYPFGYGLSYTTFKIWGVSLSEAEGVITMAANVTNTGACAGKEVVQVYYSAPQGQLGKPKRELIAFQKTKLLKPQETQSIAMSFSVSEMASYDDLGKIRKSAYVLETGNYEFYVGNSVWDAKRAAFVYSLEEDRIVQQLSEKCAPCELKERMLSDGTMEALPLRAVEAVYPKNEPLTASAPKETVLFENVGKDCTLEEFIAQMTDDELCEFMSASPNTGVSNTFCFSAQERLGVPGMPTVDGPAGVRLNEECGVPTTAWPCATLLACTWNQELVEEVGAAGGLEVKENNLAVWLTPALNIHRSPLCGRNFEYYSEDPFISGKMAAAMVRGIQSNRITCSVKHFSCNNKEINRLESDSRVSERALREIYLKGFEICVKESDPWTVMSSYNRLNGIHTSERHDLLTGILREEWGFQGMITSDWGCKNNPVNEVKAGNDMKMHIGYPEDLKAALKTGELTRADLEDCAKHILNVYMRFE